ncbi:MAG: extradiol dioxygenase [Runella slithyformis]|nr:MAG: extradiol dioxygenase [Runella slithyformis]TAF26608.1 MAG: extradiol dioxygenase [Runella slithyformis]TAF45376.1 MAG: extradiol dioxygenase [Runella slithyformis]TAF79488.1 MAG: extradiol dioxygenase [Runella slithyformis]
MKKALFIFHFTFLILHVLFPHRGVGGFVIAQNRDTQAPKSSEADALTLPLFGATLCTVSLEETQLFYEKGFGMTLRGPVQQDAKSKALERKMYGIAADIDWQLYFLERPTTPALKVRVMLLNKPTPTIHKSWNTLELGVLALGFPNDIQPKLDSTMRRVGFGAWAPMNTYQVDAPDKSKYTVFETIFNGPDFVKGVGITRGDGMNQLSPTDSLTGYGGPGYSSVIVDNSDQIIDFYVNVLGYEVRSDRVWTTSGALGVPAGTQYRFLTIYAKGSRWGHLLFIEFKNQKAYDVGVAKKIPNRGLGCWTFPCKDLNAVWQKAKEKKYTILQPPTAINSPYYGQRKAMTLLAPNGFLIEIFQN